jgi:hypothetical protein
MPLDRGGYGETHLLLQLAEDAARGEEEEAPMASVESQLGETALARYREGGSGNRGGYGVFQLTAELGVVVDEAKAHRPAPFIGG